MIINLFIKDKIFINNFYLLLLLPRIPVTLYNIICHYNKYSILIIYYYS